MTFLPHILYLPTRYFPSISGAEFYIQRMAELLRPIYNIDVFTSNAIDFRALKDAKGKTINTGDKYFNEVNGVKIRRLPITYELTLEEKIKNVSKLDAYKSLNLGDACLEEFLKNGPYLGELLESFSTASQIDYELIHTTFYPYFNLIIGLIIGKIFRKPTVCTPFFHFANPRYIENEMVDVLKRYDLLIACTRAEKDFLIKNYGILDEKIVINPMGVDYERFQNSSSQKVREFNFKNTYLNAKEKKHKMVLFCAYKNYEKGAISILKSIPYILEKTKKVTFIFIGPPTEAYNRELSKIRKGTRSRIINLTPENLTGYYDKKKIAAFKESDVYLMPSRSDAFGIAFLEAWASGKPVIGANIGATPEVIRDGKDGFLVEFDNPQDIAEKVLLLLKKIIKSARWA